MQPNKWRAEAVILLWTRLMPTYQIHKIANDRDAAELARRIEIAGHFLVAITTASRPIPACASAR
jgi:hypothetical protein